MAGQRPDYTVKARTGRKDGEDKDIFVTCGAAWNFRNGNGVNVQVSTLPVGWDGYLMLSEPKDDER